MSLPALRRISISHYLLSAAVLMSASCIQQTIPLPPEAATNSKTADPVTTAASTPVAVPATNESEEPAPPAVTETPVTTRLPAPPQKPIPATPSSSDDNELVVIAPGESEKISSTASLDYIRVISDSRCPAGTQCIWAGEVKIELKLHSGTDEKIFTLTDRAKNTTVLGMEVELLTIDRANVATLRIRKI